MLTVVDGPSRQVGVGGIVVGRQRDCDIVVTDPRVSRRHVLVRLTNDGAEAVPLGKSPIEINGKCFDKARALANGDCLELLGLKLMVELRTVRADPRAHSTYQLERARGGSFGVVHSPFVIGGADADDLIIKRWPAHALRLRVAQGELFVEATTGKLEVNGNDVDLDTLHALEVGDMLRYRGESFVVRHAGEPEGSTALAALDALPVRVVVEMLPRGGRVVFSVGGRDHAVYLADRRLDLLIALLRPPDGAPGDFVPDDAVRSIVWPRNPGVSRPEINSLISRCRRDLVEAGLAGSRLLVRAPTGGATRIALASGAEVVIAS